MGRTTRTRIAVAIVLALLAGCGPSSTRTEAPADSTLAPGSTAAPGTAAPVAPQLTGRIEVNQSAVLLTGSGQTAQLSAITANGLPITWRSSDPAQVTVDQQGNVTAVTDLGGALIFAEAGDRSTPVPVLVAQPAPNAVLVSDAQILGEPQPFGDPNALPKNGDRYRVTLTGVQAPQAGAILLATGSARIGGRVISTNPSGANIDVEYELVPLPQLLQRYNFAFALPLDPRDAGLDPVAANDQFASVGSAPIPQADAQNADTISAEKKAEFKKGPLTCSASAAAKFKSTEFDIKATTNLSLQVEGRKEDTNSTNPEHTKVVLTGPLSLDVFGGLRAEAGFEGSAGCELKKHIPIPIGGVLALVLAVTIPIGIAATAEGKVKAVDVELGPKGHLGTSVTIGFQCDASACWAITEHTPDQNNGISFESKINFLRDMRVEASVGINIVTGLGFKVGTADYSLIDAKIGPVQSFDLAFDDAQARDQAYASAYDLKVAGSVTPGEDLKTAISRLLGGEVTLDLSAKYNSEPIAQSPKGTLSADKGQVQLGKSVKLSVDLDSKSISYFLLGPNVLDVSIYRWKDDSLTKIGSAPITTSGQTHFEYEWTPTRDFVGMNELVAFVTSKVLPFVPLEVAPNSPAFVDVVEACLGDPATPPPVPVPGATAGPVPVATPPQERPPQDCGSGIVTISKEKHGTYTSARGNPVQLDLSSTATITFDLVADEFDPESLNSSESTITWSYSMTAVEAADGCTITEKAEGGGSWEGEDGPGVLLGWSAPDGTIFGMLLDETKYVLTALPPMSDVEEGDPRGFYQASSDICGEIQMGFKFPFTATAIVDGLIPPSRSGTFSGSRQRTIEPMFGLDDIPEIETVTWSFNVAAPVAPTRTGRGPAPPGTG